MISRTYFDSLTTGRRRLLVKHIDKVVHVDRGNPAFASLLRDGLIQSSTLAPTPRPVATVLTDAGRNCVAMILAEYADALVSAGFMESSGDLRPLEVLARLRELRRAQAGFSQTNPAKSPNRKNSTNPESSSDDMGR